MESSFASDARNVSPRGDPVDPTPNDICQDQSPAEEVANETEIDARGRDAKGKMDEIINDFFVNAMDMDSFIDELDDLMGELSVLVLPFDPIIEVIKRMVTASMDQSGRQRELISRVLASASGVIFESTDVVEAMAIVISRMSDIELDCPNVCDYLCRFLARAVVDEVIPPKSLSPLSSLASAKHGPVVIEATTVLIKSYHNGLDMDRVWGLSAASDIPSLKKGIDSLLEELLVEEDIEECIRCIFELHLSFFHHEVIKRAVVLALDRDDRARELIIKFFLRCDEENLITPNQFVLGLHRLYESLEDIRLDAPHADAYIAAVAKALQERGIVEAEEVEKARAACRCTKQLSGEEEDAVEDDDHEGEEMEEKVEAANLKE